MQYPIEPVILTHKIDFTVSEKIYLSLLRSIRENKGEKIKRFKFREDALRSLTGELLLKYALEKYYNLEYAKEIIAEDEFGKPHLRNKQIYFNISHSGNWTVLVCYINDAGIDLEKIETPSYEIMSKNFTRKEIEQIKNSDMQIKAKQFYKMWTLKESYIKMLGQGLSIPLDSFSINMRDQISINVKDINRQTTDINFKLFYPDSEHIMSVCLRNYNKEISPVLIHYRMLLS